MKGEILQIQDDSEHLRGIYILTKLENIGFDKSNFKFYIFAFGKLNDVTSAMGSVLKEEIQIIPFFSPAENSQFLIYDPIDNQLGNDDSPGKLKNFEQNKGSLRVYEFFNINDRLNIVCNLKFVCDKLKSFCDSKYGLHTALSTDLSKNLILITRNDMHVLDLESAERVEHFDRKNLLSI